MNGAGEEKKTSPWVYVAIGCSIPVILIAILLGATMFWGYRVAREIREASPETRAEKVKQVLGCKTIPEGYHPMMTMSIPWVMDLAILSDRAPDFDQKRKHERPFDKQGFIYVNAIRGKRGRTIRDYVEGKADASEILGQNVQMGEREEIGRGSFPLDGTTAYYITNRGSLVADRQPMRGIVTIVYFDCGDSRFRMGVWFGPDPREGQPLGTPADYAGSHADEGEIRSFISQFAPCAR